jgi:glycosyltransferase 2 family protein
VNGRPSASPGARSLRRATAWAGLAATVVFAALAVRGVRLHDVADTILAGSAWWLVPALALTAVATVARAQRWRLLFSPSSRPSLAAATEASLIGYLFNIVMPARLGEVARIVALRRRSGTSRAESASTVVVERVFDVLSLLVLLFAAQPVLPRVASLRVAGVLAAVLSVGLIGVVVSLAVWRERPVRWALRPFRRVPGLSARGVEEIADSLVDGLGALRRWRQAVLALAWTAGSWLVLAVSAWCILQESGLHPPLGASILVIVATGLSAVIPAGPAGLGVFEAAGVVALAAYDVPRTEALSYTLVFHALNVAPFVVAGLVALYLQGRLRPAQPTRSAA